MTYFSQIRAGLIASALLLTTALASPAMAETLPEISPHQIASDVKVQYHPQTGAREYVAPSFDPFEEDRAMAGTASLRSVGHETTIDGQSVRGGALLDMTFYYNSASNDPYDTRGYEDAVYLSGEYAPVTRRDNRILECNEQVQDVVYYHEDYYRPSLYVNLFRPYRHYRGHYGFSRGYGYDFYGHGYRGYRGYRRGHDADRRRRRNRRNATGRIIDRAVEDARRTVTPREERADRNRRSDRNRSDRDRSDRSREERRAAREGRRADRDREGRRADREGRQADRDRNNIETRRGEIIRRPFRLGSHSGAAGRRSNSGRRTTPRGNDRLAGAATRRAAPRAGTSRPAPSSRPAPAPRAATPAPRAERAAPAPRAQRAERSRPARTERSRPARAERAVNRASEIKSRNAPRRSGGRKGNAKLRLMSFLPMASAWSRNVVRNVDVQCAREEMLTVHIPQERLDAARFDGLTILVLDRAGDEVPVFIPPNYIEGFRQAVDGRVTPNVSYQEPRPYGIEEAPCPAGTRKQADGTCLQSGTVTYGGYPTR